VQNIDPSVWVHESSYLYGKLSIGEGSSVWPNVVMRSEMHHIEIGRMTNIQDFAMIHVGSRTPTIIGDFCSITHHCTIHGATIGDSCLIGINATIMDGAVIGAGSIVAGGAFVPEGKEYPPNSVIMGSPATVKVERDNHQANRINAWLYNRNAQFYAQGRHDAWSDADFDAWMAAKSAEVLTDADLF
jgi:carbonic anhydrase/acetyltransferase-like protein (isoleucine patch superfamily)